MNTCVQCPPFKICSWGYLSLVIEADSFSWSSHSENCPLLRMIQSCNSHAQISELIFMLNGSYCVIFYFLLLDCPELKITATDIEKLLIAYTGWQYLSGNFCYRENTIKGRRCWSCLVRMPWALCCLLPSKYEIHVHVT